MKFGGQAGKQAKFSTKALQTIIFSIRAVSWFGGSTASKQSSNSPPFLKKTEKMANPNRFKKNSWVTGKVPNPGLKKTPGEPEKCQISGGGPR